MLTAQQHHHHHRHQARLSLDGWHYYGTVLEGKMPISGPALNITVIIMRGAFLAQNAQFGRPAGSVQRSPDPLAGFK